VQLLIEILVNKEIIYL